jgi:valyl-tRNA synthetase
MELLREFGTDGFRYWAVSGRLGTDAAFDAGQMRIGRRLAVKLMNASKFVLGVAGSGEEPSAPATGPAAGRGKHARSPRRWTAPCLPRSAR